MPDNVPEYIETQRDLAKWEWAEKNKPKMREPYKKPELKHRPYRKETNDTVNKR